ncbi:cation:proton antiporter, partial [Candidatus Woesearchaeota archaeon]|nr:cation:proton antiporter [Candidatus Woesearchaeota archaeon]
TSTAIIAAALKHSNKLKSDIGKKIMGASAVNDVLGLLMFSVVMQMNSSSLSVVSISVKAIAAVLMMGFFFMIGKLLSNQLHRLEFWGFRNGHSNMSLLATLLLAFVFASFLELIGLSAIIGAFVAGLALEQVENKSFRQGVESLEVIFGSIFFVTLGLLVTNLKDVIMNLHVVVVLVIATIISKYLAGFIAGGWFNLKPRDSKLIGLGMMPVGEIAALVALKGLQSGVFDNAVYSNVIFVGVATSIFVPMMLDKALGIMPKKRAMRIKVKHNGAYNVNKKKSAFSAVPLLNRL